MAYKNQDFLQSQNKVNDTLGQVESQFLKRQALVRGSTWCVDWVQVTCLNPAMGIVLVFKWRKLQRWVNYPLSFEPCPLPLGDFSIIGENFHRKKEHALWSSVDIYFLNNQNMPIDNPNQHIRVNQKETKIRWIHT